MWKPSGLPKEGGIKVSVYCFKGLSWVKLGAASIVFDNNGAGWPQTRVNCWQLVVVATTNIAIMTAKFVSKYSKLGQMEQKLDNKNMYFLASELYGCSFQAPHCLTQM